MIFESQFYDLLEKDEDLGGAYESVTAEIHALQQSKLDYEHFLKTQIQEHACSLDMSQCIREYSRVHEHVLDDTRFDMELLEEIISCYDEQRTSTMVGRLEVCLDFIRLIEEFVEQSTHFNKFKSKYLDPKYLDPSRIEQYRQIKLLKDQIVVHPISESDSKLTQSVITFHSNLLNSLSYHSAMQLKSHFIQETGSSLQIDLTLYKWACVNSLILEKENTSVGQLYTALAHHLERLSVVSYTSDPPSMHQTLNMDTHTIITLNIHSTVPGDQLFTHFIEIVKIIVDLGVRLEYDMLGRLWSLLNSKFKQLLINLLETQVEQREQVVETILAQMERVNGEDRIDDFIQDLNIPLLLEKHTQLSLIDQVNQSLVGLKDSIVLQNQVFLSNIALFSKPPEAKAGMLKSFLTKKSIRQDPFQIGAEAQKIQSHYFMVLSAQLKHFLELVEKAIQQIDPWQVLKKLWSHFVLIKFLFSDLDRNVPVQSFHYLNFLVSITTHVDESLKEYLQHCHLVITQSTKPEEFNEFMVEVIDFQVQFKKNLNKIRLKLNQQRKIEFSHL